MPRLRLVLLLPATLLLMAFRQVPLVDPPPIAVPGKMTSAQVEKAVKQALIKREWMIASDAPGEITATLTHHDYSVSIGIAYDVREIRIRYLDSTDLKYEVKNGQRLIHKNYPSWIQDLVTDISNDLAITPSDARLVAEAAPKPEQTEAIRAALDAHLASSLKDPASSIQYSAGEPTECRNVATSTNTMAQLRDSWCVCYYVNAKNSMGGYTGTQLGVVSLINSGPPFFMLDMPKELINRPSGCKNVTPRDAALIHAFVK